MQAQNYKEITTAYLKFSGYLSLCILIGVLIYFFFNLTSVDEVNRIVEKTKEYDKVYSRQTDLIERVDTLFYYSSLFNTNRNDAQLLHSVSRRKQMIISLIDDMDSRDVLLVRKLMGQINMFLAVKDSIRIAKTEEDLLKADLLKCTEENRLLSRKITLGDISLNK